MRKRIKSYSNFVGRILSTLRWIRLPNWVKLSAVLFGLVLVCWFLLREPTIESPQLETISPIDRIAFHSHWELRLPTFRPLFEQFAQKHNVDWALLSVVGYQESKWLQDAVSPTGVRGVMMLTRRTAKEVGVSDRTDPEQSIAGGARYLNYLLGKAPDDLDLEGQKWFAVSAYNGGIGRLRKAYKRWRKSTSAGAVWLDFENAMLTEHPDPLIRTAMLYTKRVRDYHRLAVWILKTE